MNTWVVSIGMVVCWAIIWFVLRPFIQQELRRRVSRQHRPQPQELWLQDHDMLLYITNVGPNGVSIAYYNGQKLEQWTDSWEDWERRLYARTVIFTGKKSPLVPG